VAFFAWAVGGLSLVAIVVSLVGDTELAFGIVWSFDLGYTVLVQTLWGGFRLATRLLAVRDEALHPGPVNADGVRYYRPSETVQAAAPADKTAAVAAHARKVLNARDTRIRTLQWLHVWIVMPIIATVPACLLAGITTGTMRDSITALMMMTFPVLGLSVYGERLQEHTDGKISTTGLQIYAACSFVLTLGHAITGMAAAAAGETVYAWSVGTLLYTPIGLAMSLTWLIYTAVVLAIRKRREHVRLGKPTF
jgi:hypothetical protein